MMRIKKAQNLNLALKFVQSKGIRLLNIGVDDFLDSNLKIILGFIWTIICKYSIDDISEEELTAKDALLLWCKKKTKGYNNVDVQNFHMSWKDGLAFCALIHAHRPDLLDFDSLNKADAAGNLQLAFDIAEQKLGLPSLLDVTDIVDTVKPDERSVMTYVAQFYHLFSANKQQEVAGRRVGKLVDLLEQIEKMKEEYNVAAGAFIEWAQKKSPAFADRTTDNTSEDLSNKITAMTDYRGGEKPEKQAEKVKIDGLFNAVAMKLRSNNRPPFVPADGFGVKDVENWWNKVGDEEKNRNDWLAKEFARWQKIEQLLNRFEQKAKALEAWNASKKQYLETVESVDSLRDAQSKLKRAEAFGEEYTASGKRVNELKSLAAELIALLGTNPKAEVVSARLGGVEGAWGGLPALHDAKVKDLKEKLALEEKKEQLRQNWAQLADAYQLWSRGVVSANNVHNFGNSIEDVEAFVSTLDSQDTENKNHNNDKKNALDAVWKELQDLHVKDNRYSALTDQDVAAFHANVLASVDSRRKAYEAELARQRTMEEARKKFAAAAADFVAHLQKRREQVAAHNSEPDPVAAVQKVKETFAEGAPDQQALQAVVALEQELGKLGVKENRHTTLTVPQLQQQSDKFGNHVRNVIAQLQDEQDLKDDFAARAKALLEWINSTHPTLAEKKSSDNTLEGARKANVTWRAYKSGLASEKGVEKSDLHALYDNILKVLAANNRPATYTPPAGHALSDVDAAWDALVAAEKVVEADIKTELSRQEKIAALVRQFNADAGDFEALVQEAAAYLQSEESVDTLNAARLHSRLLQVKQEEVAAAKSQLEALQAVQGQIAGLNYHDVAAINARVQALSDSYANLSTLAAAKGEKLKAANATEEAKESLRRAYATAANSFSRFVREALDQANDNNFGNSLATVSAAKADVDSLASDLNGKAAALRADIDKVSADIQAHNVAEPHKHSRVKPEDVENLTKSLADALTKREQAYQSSLETQQRNDAKCAEFAKLADAFVAHLHSEREAIEKLDGAPEAKQAQIADLHKDGAAAKESLAAISALAAEMESLGIFTNIHTSHSASSLTGKNEQQEAFVKNTLQGLTEEKIRHERAAQQKAELEAREKLEGLQIEYNLKAGQLATFFESADDLHAEATRVKSVAEAKKSQDEYNTFSAQFNDQKAVHDELVALADQLKASGVEVAVADVTARFQATQAASDERKAALVAEVARQEANDVLCKEYAGVASEFQKWLHSVSASVVDLAGELDEQIKKLGSALEALHGGNDKLTGVQAHQQKLEDAQVTENPHTDLQLAGLSSEYKELVDSLRKRQDVLEKDLLAKKMGDVTPEQLAEFRDMFHHFDKGNKGFLVPLEFKGALQSLGEDFNDAQLAAIVKELDSDGDGKISFDEFVSFLRKRVQDSDSQEQILESFKALSGGKEFITAEDLARSGMPSEKVKYLSSSMPAYAAVEGGLDFKAWVEKAYPKN
jgi:Ca2+-binding EF-hand superfamily protein